MSHRAPLKRVATLALCSAMAWQVALPVSAQAPAPAPSPAPAPAPNAPTPAPAPAPAPVAPAPAPVVEPAPAPAPAPEVPGAPAPVEPAPVAPAPVVEPAPVEPVAAEPEEVLDLSVGTSADVTMSESGDETVTVTGSRIAGSTVQEASHIAVVTQEDIKKTNATTIDEVLRRLPSVSLQGINKTDNNGGNGLATVDLRNLGASRTLILVNGRRMVNAGLEVVDLNTIPVALIERIDVLLEGASVIYGSDAVAGVINIILKDDFEGVQADVFGGISTKGDGEELAGSLTMGTNHDRGNITINLQTLLRGNIKQRDRDWAVPTIAAKSYANGYDESGGINTSYDSSIGGEGLSLLDGVYFRPDPETGRSFQPFTSANGRDHKFSYAKRQYLAGSQERFQITALADYDITKRVRIFTEALYTYRHSQTKLAPQPMTGSNTRDFAIGLDNPFVPQDYLATVPAGTDLSDPANSILMYRRMLELGNRTYEFDVNSGRAVIGFAGDVPKYELDWEIYGNVGISRTSEKTTNSLNNQRTFESADPALCAQLADKGCVVADFFGPNSLSPAAVDYLRYTDISTNGFSQVSAGADVGAKPVELWAGKLGLAAGALYRREAGYTSPSAATVQGESGGNLQDPTSGHFSSIEFFGEVALPLARDLPGIDTLDVDVAARFSRYTSFGSKGTYRVSGVYGPIEALKLRGTYSKAFRNPGIGDLYGGYQDNFLTLQDPCNNWENNSNAAVRENCAAAGVPMGFEQPTTQVRGNTGGNKDLGAETASIWSVGGVFNADSILPEKAGNLTFSLDYYNVVVKDAISSPEGQYLLDSCYETGSNCNTITRGPTGAIGTLRAVLLNIGESSTAGFDISSNYSVALGNTGLRANLGWQGNRLLYYDDTIAGDKVRYGKKITTNSGTFTEWRWLTTVGISGENWSVTSFNRYIGGAKFFNVDWGSSPVDWVDQVTYWDLAGSYSVSNFTVSAGINNVLDTDPPFFLDGSVNSNGSTYDLIGRYFFTRLSYKM